MRQKFTVATAGTPLRSLTAIALDTETTSLDVRTRASWKLAPSPFSKAGSFPSFTSALLVNPHGRSRLKSVAIHGITDDAVKSADKFAQVYRLYRDFAGAHVILGYAVGFDLAMLRREHERAGLAWKAPRFLDVRDLARLLRPDLPDFSLETLRGLARHCSG